ncbi:MAG: TolB family protein [Candidatus Limnocylindria bacterium]
MRILGVLLICALAGCDAPPARSTHDRVDATPGVAATAAPASSPTASARRAPASAGVVPDAGILFVAGADDVIYRYDGRTGALDAIWAKSTFGPRSPNGAYVFGRAGGAEFLGWDGAKMSVTCGARFTVSVVAGIGCTSVGTDGVYVQLSDEQHARQILPPDWGASSPVLSPDGRRLLVVRSLEPRPGPGMDPGLSALWLVGPDGRPREVYRPTDRGVLATPVWSPDGTKSIVRQIESTSNSFAADGVGISTILVDLGTGASRSLGVTRSETWSADGRLAFVRGAGRMTWWNKELVVLDANGTEHRISAAIDPAHVALAPAWGPRGEIAWVSGPAVDDYNGAGYIDGAGAGQRVGAILGEGRDEQITCAAGRVVEGISWSVDGERLLVLCRKPGNDPRPLELWLYRFKDGTSVPLVTGVGSDDLARGFGFYGAQPSLSTVAAWSLATSP